MRRASTTSIAGAGTRSVIHKASSKKLIVVTAVSTRGF